MSRSLPFALAPFIFFSLLLVAISPFVGAFDAWDGFSLSDEGVVIITRMRLPRAVVAFSVGGILATAGLVCQTMVQNPLATPTTLGVSGGAALGATLVILFGLSLPLSSASSLGAITGAALISFLLLSLARIVERAPSGQIVLIGILVNYLVASLILFVQSIADPAALSRIVIWLIGSIPPLSWVEAVILMAVACWMFTRIWYRALSLNALALGRDAAASRGVAVQALERSLMISMSVGVGAAISACGGIGFVGILEPQVCRRFVGSDFRRLTPAVFLLGGAVVLAADLLGRIIYPPFEVAAGVLTPLIEIPFGLFLLIRGWRYQS
jgi:iron complex transport system permease protein